MTFVVDRMLGTLARWLRVLGYDTLYPGPLTDLQLLQISRAQDRILITRDTKIAKRKDDRVFFISSDKPDEQLRQVIRELKVKVESKLFTRCLECNSPLEKVSKEEVEGKVPPYVFAHHQGFKHCHKCDKYYWQGTHWERITKKMKKFKSIESR
jgi:hypothetical protein